jgi:hypothetical protein
MAALPFQNTNSFFFIPSPINLNKCFMWATFLVYTLNTKENLPTFLISAVLYCIFTFPFVDFSLFYSAYVVRFDSVSLRRSIWMQTKRSENLSASVPLCFASKWKRRAHHSYSKIWISILTGSVCMDPIFWKVWTCPLVIFREAKKSMLSKFGGAKFPI